MREAIIAADAMRAEAYAFSAGWMPEADHRAFTRIEGEGDDKRTVRIEYVPTPEALLTITLGTPIHVGPFPGGMPARWAKALSRHSVVTDI